LDLSKVSDRRPLSVGVRAVGSEPSRPAAGEKTGDVRFAVGAVSWF
jgi:hypothetical protein